MYGAALTDKGVADVVCTLAQRARVCISMEIDETEEDWVPK